MIIEREERSEVYGWMPLLLKMKRQAPLNLTIPLYILNSQNTPQNIIDRPQRLSKNES